MIRAYAGSINPIALRMAKTLLSFGHSECNRVKNPLVPAKHIVESKIIAITGAYIVIHCVSSTGPFVAHLEALQCACSFATLLVEKLCTGSSVA